MAITDPALNPNVDYPQFISMQADVARIMAQAQLPFSFEGTEQEIKSGFMNWFSIPAPFQREATAFSEGITFPFGAAKFIQEMTEGKHTIDFSADKITAASQIIPATYQKVYGSGFSFDTILSGIGDYFSAIVLCLQTGDWDKMGEYAQGYQAERANKDAFMTLVDSGFTQAEAGTLTGVYPDSNGILIVHFAPPHMDGPQREKYMKFAEVSGNQQQKGLLGLQDSESAARTLGFLITAGATKAFVVDPAVAATRGTVNLVKDTKSGIDRYMAGNQGVFGKLTEAERAAIRTNVYSIQAAKLVEQGATVDEALLAINRSTASLQETSRLARLGQLGVSTTSLLTRFGAGAITIFQGVIDGMEVAESIKNCDDAAMWGNGIVGTVSVATTGPVAVAPNQFTGALAVAGIPIRWGLESLFEANGIDIGNDNHKKAVMAIVDNTLDSSALYHVTTQDVREAIETRQGPVWNRIVELEKTYYPEFSGDGSQLADLIKYATPGNTILRPQSTDAIDDFILPFEVQARIIEKFRQENPGVEFDAKNGLYLTTDSTTVSQYTMSGIASELRYHGPLYLRLQSMGLTTSQIDPIAKQLSEQANATRESIEKTLYNGQEEAGITQLKTANADHTFRLNADILNEDGSVALAAGTAFDLPTENEWIGYNALQAASIQRVLREHQIKIESQCATKQTSSLTLSNDDMVAMLDGVTLAGVVSAQPELPTRLETVGTRVSGVQLADNNGSNYLPPASAQSSTVSAIG